MFLILIPFGWQATATMISKLRLSSTPQTHAKTPPQQALPASPQAPRPDAAKPAPVPQPATIPVKLHNGPPSISPAQPSQAAPVIPPAAAPQPSGGPNCPNNSGFCTNTNNGTQQQFFDSPHPAPMAHFSLNSLPSGVQPNRDPIEVGGPGVELAIRTDGDFPSPTFHIICGGWCLPTSATVWTRNGSFVSGIGIHYRTAPDPSDPKGFIIKFTVPSGTLEQGQTIVLRLRTGGLAGPDVTSVTSITE